MPEIKNTFIKGRMNKDLDERIVPSGEYKDAMNVQVSTTDDSDIGCVQNIASNIKMNGLGTVTGGYKCIASIPDEKNNKLYWFITNQSDTDAIIEYDGGGNDDVTPVIVDKKAGTDDAVLKFTSDTITGVNIIDNLLFWTDNNSEPKKINITSFLNNSHTDLNTHSKFWNTDKPVLQNINIVVNGTQSATATITVDSVDDKLNAGDELVLINGLTPSQTINIVSLDSNNNQITVSVTENFTDNDILVFASKVDVEEPDITVIKKRPLKAPTVTLTTTEDDDESIIFEKVFPRFSYRYKYIDGEYSAFGPFTDVIFSPKPYSFPVEEPYNEGMLNKITSVEIKDFVSPDIPKDVVEIDILYKEEGSTVVYLIETIKETDPKLLDGKNNWTTTGSNSNSGYKGSYSISSESIHSAVPSNQMLRPWDNVPKKALAQEITSNRLVYGNYTQGYDLGFGDDDSTIKPNIVASYNERLLSSGFSATSADFTNGLKSIKSLRDYQLGVVYGDKYGRETPVFTNAQASITIPWSKEDIPGEFNASKTNQLIAKLQSYTPEWAEYYKVFIKETSNEYYNLVMDRVYKAEEEGNIWMSFPSSDRNKIKEEDFIILKRSEGIDGGSSIQVDTKNKFKIIDIKNEAPESIKYIYEGIGEAGGTQAVINSLFDDNTATLSGNQEDTHPSNPTIQFKIKGSEWLDNGGMKLDNSFNKEDDIYFSFYRDSGNGLQYSQRYKVTQVHFTGSYYHVQLEEEITIADSWCNDGTSSDFLESTMRVKFEKKVFRDLEHLAGRFFVKIASNSVSEKYIEQSLNYSGDLDYVTHGPMIPGYLFADVRAAIGTASSNGIVNTTNTFTMPTDDVENINLNKKRSHLASSWANIMTEVATYAPTTHGDNGKTWVIDSLYMASAQEGWPFDAGKSGRMWNGWSGGNDGENIVDGLEGIVKITDAHASIKANGNVGDGPRRWKVSSSHLDGTLDSTYKGIRDGDRYYLHLSFIGCGEDLYDPTGVNINNPSWYNHSAYAEGNNSTTYQGQSNFPYLQNIRNTTEWKQGLSSSGVTIPGENFGGSHTQINFGNKYWWGITKTASGPSQNGQEMEKIQNQWNPAWHSSENGQIVSNLFKGARFKFKGDSDDTVYEILNIPVVKRLYNHTSWNMMYEWDGTAGSTVLQEKISSDSGVDASVERAARDWAVGGFHPSSNDVNKEKLRDTLANFGKANNRRVCYIIELDKDPTEQTYNPLDGSTVDANTPANIQFLRPKVQYSGDIMSSRTAIWETDPQTKDGLDIYYEASQAYPFKLTFNNRELFAPVGCRVTIDHVSALSGNIQVPLTPVYLDSWDEDKEDTFILSPGFNYNDIDGNAVDYDNVIIRFWREDNSYTTAKITSNPPTPSSNDYKTEFTIDTTIDPGYNEVGLSWYNCISFGNGVESDRVRDDFNLPQITNGVKASTTIEAQYKEEHRKNGLIYSGIYNSISGVNNLNQFIQAEGITKDLNPTYGSIQKLFQRRVDLVSFCEDKVVKVTAGKDVLFNAQGDPQLISTNKVLGDATPFVGDYGISTDPASFASESYRAYFTDRQRGAVLRLSMDGLTPISDAGMSRYFKNNLPGAGFVIGTYDVQKSDYNLTLNNFTGDNLIINSEAEEGQALEEQINPELLLNPDFLSGTNLNQTPPPDVLLNGNLDTILVSTPNPDGLVDISANPNKFVDDDFGFRPDYFLIEDGYFISGGGQNQTANSWGNSNLYDNNGVVVSIHDSFAEGHQPYSWVAIEHDRVYLTTQSTEQGNFGMGGTTGPGENPITLDSSTNGGIGSYSFWDFKDSNGNTGQVVSVAGTTHSANHPGVINRSGNSIGHYMAYNQGNVLYCNTWQSSLTVGANMWKQYVEVQPHLIGSNYPGRANSNNLVLKPGEKVRFKLEWKPVSINLTHDRGIIIGIHNTSLSNVTNGTQGQAASLAWIRQTQTASSSHNYYTVEVEYENTTGADLTELSFAWSNSAPGTNVTDNQSFLVRKIVIEKTLEIQSFPDTHVYTCDNWNIESDTGRTASGNFSWVGNGGVPGDSPTNNVVKDVAAGADSLIQDHGTTFLQDNYHYHFKVNACFGFTQDQLLIKNTGNSPDPFITIDNNNNTAELIWTQSGDSNLLEIEAVDGSTGTLDNMELLDITAIPTGGEADNWSNSPGYNTYLNNYYDTPRTYWENGKIVFNSTANPATDATRIIQDFASTGVSLPASPDGYELSFEVSDYVEGILNGFIYGADDGTGTANGFVIPDITADGTYTYNFNFDGVSAATTSSGSMNKIVFKAESTPINLKLDNISLKDKTIYYLNGSLDGWEFEGFDTQLENNIYWDNGVIKFEDAETGNRLKQAIVGSSFVEGNKYKLKLNVSNVIGNGTLMGYYYNNVGKGFKFGPIQASGDYEFDVTVGSETTTDANLYNLFYIEVTSIDNFTGDLDNITLQRTFATMFPTTITYSEDVKGWVSFKSFVPENGLSLAGNYFTFKDGILYKHHAGVTRNVFYNESIAPSTITTILNMQPDFIKDFRTISYEGSQSNVVKNLDDAVSTGNYYNLEDKDGWSISKIFTDKQQGSINEFIEKEGKWFNYIKGDPNVVDTAAFNFQGIGIINEVITP